MRVVMPVEVKSVEVVSIQCDKCKVAYDREDVIQMQDFAHFADTGGYGSAWGDGTKWSVDLCGPCAVEVLGPFARRFNDGSLG